MDESIENHNFWDCDCKKNYVHSKDYNYCPLCRTPRRTGDGAQPDSKQYMVLKYDHTKDTGVFVIFTTLTEGSDLPNHLSLVASRVNTWIELGNVILGINVNLKPFGVHDRIHTIVSYYKTK